MPNKDPVVLASQTILSISEVEALFELFKSISSSVIDDGLINKEEFQLALFKNKKENFFANRIFDLFDARQKGVINFGAFVGALSFFHPDAPVQDKIEFSFKLFDLNGNGFIERQEVKQMLIAFSETEMRLADETTEVILDETFSDANVNQDGKIDKAEWAILVSRSPPLMKIMTLPHPREVTTTFPPQHSQVLFLTPKLTRLKLQNPEPYTILLVQKMRRVKHLQHFNIGSARSGWEE